MRLTSLGKGAAGSILRGGCGTTAAPFSFAALCASFLLIAARPVPATECPAVRIDERVQVVYVYDGDTVKLKDGRRLRLIGINTPEMAHADASDEPLAITARSSLQDMLDRGNYILHLQYGTQREDHYGRLLAHAFLENGDNVAVRLLSHGLATALVVPPNTWAMDCYRRLEDDARIDRLGLWALPQYRTQASTSLPADTTGFRIVRGRVTAIRKTSRSTWLDLQGRLTLHISHSDRASFTPRYLEQLTGHDVEARGWIKTGRDGLRMNIRHPAALVTIFPGTLH